MGLDDTRNGGADDDPDKGKGEGLVGFARRNFLVPIPVFDSFEARLTARSEDTHGQQDPKPALML
jgi:hypothetical protein